ncbi:tetratricopeptide repeat protein [Acidisphaera sp. L21]|uniref:tetratricopeptide repeat-containing glycosyltransferase family protein n=1 Tax=Acidisphaera sp. L21 TaxID=1641851 RepID=UPI00131C9E67|nr:tetratricopeptide repeat protein [Acidisphaera sp. L21]
MPDPIEALLLAITHSRAGRYVEAETILCDVLAAEPDQPNALFLLGQCMLADGRAAEATSFLARGLALRPTHRDGRVALARAQMAAGEPFDALDTLAPLVGDHGLAAVHTLRGTALNALGRPAEAVDAFTIALRGSPLDAETHLNLGNAHSDLGKRDLAERHIRNAIAIKPDLAEAHASLGHLLAETHRLAEAVACAQAAIDLQPDFAAAHWNQGVALLLSGDMAAGWEKYEWRKRRFPDSFTNPPGLQWDGGPLDGRTILVLAEQGLGDTIQFARYFPMLAARGATVMVECAGSLVLLLQAMPGVAIACTRGERPDHDLWVDQMSLPRLFRTTLADVPAPTAYLQADPARAAHWNRLLPVGLRVGLVWAGNPLHSNDANRSMPIAALGPILDAAQGSLISLQVGASASEVASLPGVADVTEHLTDWKETASAIASMDLIVTVDTAVAHMAGALGIPVWVMLPYAPDWRWMLDRTDSPWYAGMRLFRQARPGDWTGVVDQVAAALAEVVRPAPSAFVAPYTIAMPPLTWSVAPVTQPASSDAK